MNFSAFGIGSVAAITALCYLIGNVIKSTPYDNDKYIPAFCGFSGICFGILALYTGMPNFPAQDPVTAAAIGAVSGLAATGINQEIRQLKKAPKT